MVCSGLKPGAAGLKAQMNPLSYGGTPDLVVVARKAALSAATAAQYVQAHRNADEQLGVPCCHRHGDMTNW